MMVEVVLGVTGLVLTLLVVLGGFFFWLNKQFQTVYGKIDKQFETAYGKIETVRATINGKFETTREEMQLLHDRVTRLEERVPPRPGPPAYQEH